MSFQESNDTRLYSFFNKYRIAFLSASGGECFIHFFNTTEVFYEFSRGLLADAGNAFDVVGRISAESFPIGNERREKAESLDHGLFVVQNRVIHTFLQGIHTDAFIVDEL